MLVAPIVVVLAACAATAAASQDRSSHPHGPLPPQTQPEPGVVAVQGSGGGILDLPAFNGDSVTFRVHASARTATPWAAEGSFDVRHVRPDGTVLADFGGTVDCLMANAGVAVATGTITRGGASGLPGEELGHRIGLTGWSWLVMGFHDAPPCMGTAPFFPITEGNLRVETPRHTAPGIVHCQHGRPAVAWSRVDQDAST